MLAMDSATQVIVEQVRAAGVDRRRLRIRGGGSKDFLGAAPRGEVLDTRPLSGITAYEPSELVVTVRAGTRLAELEAELAANGQHLPFEPPHYGAASSAESVATCGGMLASGLSGPGRASTGSVRDYVLGLTMLNGRAETLVFGGQVMKNVAGYDLSRLLAGSMGELGVALEMSLKVLPIPQADATLRFELPLGQALSMLNGWIGQALPVHSSLWHQESGRPQLSVRLRGASAAVESACATLGGERQDAGAAARDWSACRDQRSPFFVTSEHPGMDLWRLSVPPTTAPLGRASDQWVEWHGGQRWMWAAPGDGRLLQSMAAQAGGHASLFRSADGRSRSASDFAPLAPALARVQRELKRRFDPLGIFDPGRLHPELQERHAD